MNKKQLKQEISDVFSPYQVTALMKLYDACKNKDVNEALTQLSIARKELKNTEERLQNKISKIVEQEIERKQKEFVNTLKQAENIVNGYKETNKNMKQTLLDFRKESEEFINQEKRFRTEIRNSLRKYMDEINARIEYIKMKVETSYRKGRTFEYEVKQAFENLGFYVTKSERSLGAFDLIATKNGNIWYIQCKLNGKLTKAEKLMLKEEVLPKLGITDECPKHIKIILAFKRKENNKYFICLTDIMRDLSTILYPRIIPEDMLQKWEEQKTKWHINSKFDKFLPKFAKKETRCSLDKLFIEEIN